jgi:hypothetical protein
MKASVVAASAFAVLLSACLGPGAPPSGGPLVPSFETAYCSATTSVPFMTPECREQ